MYRPDYTLNEYQGDASKTAADCINVTIGALGLTGEAGEFADEVKKHLAQDHPLDEEKLIEELGDILWYVATTADHLGVTLAGVACRNRDKLRDRYPEGFTTKASINRDEPD